MIHDAQDEYEASEDRERLLHLLTISAGHGFTLLDNVEVPGFLNCTSILFDAELLGWKKKNDKLILRIWIPPVHKIIPKNYKVTLNFDPVIYGEEEKFKRRIDGQIKNYKKTIGETVYMDCELELNTDEQKKMIDLLEQYSKKHHEQIEFRKRHQVKRIFDGDVTFMNIRVPFRTALLLTLCGLAGATGLNIHNALRHNSHETCQILADGKGLNEGDYKWPFALKPSVGNLINADNAQLDETIEECRAEFDIEIPKTTAKEAIRKTREQENNLQNPAHSR